MLDFGSQIVLRVNQVKPPYSLDVVLSSNEAADISWQMGLPTCEGLEGCGGVFAMEPSSGTLAKVRSTGSSTHNRVCDQHITATLALSKCQEVERWQALWLKSSAVVQAFEES